MLILILLILAFVLFMIGAFSYWAWGTDTANRPYPRVVWFAFAAWVLAEVIRAAAGLHGAAGSVPWF
jgi:hypothetical protein